VVEVLQEREEIILKAQTAKLKVPHENETSPWNSPPAQQFVDLGYKHETR
jgi:hypothetical protein